MVTDALSNMYMMQCFAVSKVQSILQMFQKLRQDYEKDKDTRKMLENIKAHPEHKILKNRIFLTSDGRMRLYIPKEELRNSVMSDFHDARFLVIWELKGQ